MEEKKILSEGLLDNASAGGNAAEGTVILPEIGLEAFVAGSVNPARYLSDAEAESAAAGVFSPREIWQVPMAARAAGANENEEALKTATRGTEPFSLPRDYGFDPLGFADDPGSNASRPDQFTLAPEVL